MLESLTSYLQGIDWAAKGEVAFYVFLYLFGAYLLTLMVRRAVKRLVRRMADSFEEPEQSDRINTLGQLIRGASIAAIWLVAGMFALQQLGVEIGPLLAAAGIGGVALGFGAQSLVKDIIAGGFVLFENQFSVGDVITAAGHTGEVEAVNLRLIRLRNAEGKVFFIPHSEANVIVNHTHKFAKVMLDFGVDYGEDMSRVKQMIEAVLAEMEEDERFAGEILETAVNGVNELGDSAVNFLVTMKVAPGRQWQLARELRGRLKIAADLTDISIPYPHKVSVAKADEPHRSTEPVDTGDLREKLRDKWDEIDPGEEELPGEELVDHED